MKQIRVPFWLVVLLLVCEFCAAGLSFSIGRVAASGTVAAQAAPTFAATRAAVIEEIRTSPVEIGYLIDASGRVLARATGDATSVTFAHADYRQARGAYMIHNHPQRCTPLSDEDLSFFARYELWGIEAVCEDGRTFSHTVLDGGAQP